MTLPAVEAIAQEFGISILDGTKYPGLRETRAPAALDRIYSNYGEAHFRMVMVTAVQTANKEGVLEAAFFWAVSDLLLECAMIVETHTDRWLEVFDRAPVDQMIGILRGHKDKRRMLKGMLYERLRVAFADQKELFPMRAA